MKTIDEIVALNIFTRLTELALTQKDLAKAIGISPVHLNKMLSGKRPVSKSNTLTEIADRLGVNEVDLYQDPARAAKWSAAEKALRAADGDLSNRTRLLLDELLEVTEQYRSLKGLEHRVLDLEKQLEDAKSFANLAEIHPDLPDLMESYLAVASTVLKNSKELKFLSEASYSEIKLRYPELAKLIKKKTERKKA